MRKIFKGLVVATSAVILASCGFNNSSEGKDGKASNANQDVGIEVVSGAYIVPPEESTVNDESYLALNVKITNKSDTKINLSMNDFALYDSEDDKAKDFNIYGDNNEFHTISTDTISGGKSTTGYVVYKVDKDSEYELRFEPTFSDYEKKSKEISLKIDASKYEDNTEKVLDLAKDYVNGVFLNGEEAANAKTLSNDSFAPQVASLSNNKSKKEKSSDDKDDKDDKKDKKKKDEIRLSNNLEEERTSFSNLFISTFTKDFDYYEPSQAEMKTFVDAYIAANVKRATIQYSLKSYTIDSAEVYIKPETIDIDSIDTSSIINDFVRNNRDSFSDYNAVRQAAEKYVLEQMPSKLDTTGLASGNSMPGEGYVVRLTKDKDSNKWTLDSSDRSDNYGYKELQSAFMGNLYAY